MTVEEHVSLGPYSTLHVGGPARFFVRVTSLSNLKEALSWAEDRAVPWFILGGGANFFCRDEGFPGLVVKMENRGLTWGGSQEKRAAEMTAEAGVVTRLAVLDAARRGLRGMEHLAGIPGTVGGAVRGNAGAFGMETKDQLLCVRVLTRTSEGWKEDVFPKEVLRFAYRDSTFKKETGKYVIWSATFGLDVGDRAACERRVEEDLRLRKERQPYEFPSVGSIFKNPSPDRTAGMLVEAAGLKGTRIGGAEVSTKHANFVVNRGSATATDVLSLIAEIRKRVFACSGVLLEEEIHVL